MRYQALDRASGRIVWIRLAGLAVVLLLAGRAAHLTVAHTRAKDLYDRQIQTEQRLSAARGTIFDRNGRELAITTEAASIYALPREMDDRAAIAHALAEVLDMDLTAIARRIANRDGFTYIKRWVTKEQAERIAELDLPGVGIDREPRRSYPAGSFAAPLLGFANIDGEGVRGIEQLENDWLTGQPRRVRVERDAKGQPLALETTDLRDVAGGDVALTLDAAMQGAAEAALQEVVARTQAEGGLVLTMDPRNGDVLALAEAPGFDPNQFRTLDYSETRSRTFTDAVEAGSTMKAFLVASAIDARLVEPDQIFETGDDGSLRVRGKTIRDRRPFGPLAPADVLRLSSNVGAVLIAQAMGREAQHAGLERFGFGKRTRSRFPFESSGILRDWNGWQPVDQAAISYGQGLSVTGIQLASALAALANDGMRMEPRIVLARRRANQGWQTTEVRTQGRAISPRAARLTLDMMQTVVAADGTGRMAALDGVRVAGKTGTAQKLDIEAKRYSNTRYMAWFMGVVPADDPEIAIVVAIDEPKGPIHSGGGIAAPLFAQVAAAQLARRGIVTHPAPIPAAPIPTHIAEREDDGESADPTPAAPKTRLADVAAAPPTAPRKKRSRTARAPETRTPSTATAALPAGPARTARVAEARPPSTGRKPALDDTLDLVFVPDFEGTTMARARRIAASESLEITTLGAIEGRVVSQHPIPGTVLEGGDRTVRLRFEQRRPTLARREEG